MNVPNLGVQTSYEPSAGERQQALGQDKLEVSKLQLRKGDDGTYSILQREGEDRCLYEIDRYARTVDDGSRN